MNSFFRETTRSRSRHTNAKLARMPPKTAAPQRLTRASLARGVDSLAEVDPDLAQIARAYGLPPLWEREEGFPTLVLTILEQQVSLASALAAFERLRAAAVLVTPENFLAFDDAQLRAFGFSRQKALYCRLLARAATGRSAIFAGWRAHR